MSLEIETDCAEITPPNAGAANAPCDTERRTCPECGREFTPEHFNQTLCSPKCRRVRLLERKRVSNRKRNKAHVANAAQKLQDENRALSQTRKASRQKREAALAAMDAKHDRLGVPVTVRVEHGVRTETRGHCFGAPSFRVQQIKPE